MSEQVCGLCRHYHLLARPRGPDGAVDMSVSQQGECREGPPHQTIHLHGNQQIMVAGYPQLPADFRACSRFRHSEAKDISILT